MSSIRYNTHSKYAMLFFLSFAVICGTIPNAGIAIGKQAYDERNVAAHIIELAGISKGFCSVLSCNDQTFPFDVLESSEFFVHVQSSQNENVDGMRRIADEKNLYGRRVIIEKRSAQKQIFADGTVDLVIVKDVTENDLDELNFAGILRVLRPLGKAIIGSMKSKDGSAANITQEQLTPRLRSSNVNDFKITEDNFGTWAVIKKPALQNADNWSHWEHAPDNNPVSSDKGFKAPYMTQWLGEPLYNTMPAITTVAGGRMFLACGHIAHHEREEAWLNTLYARNGYNGIKLWTRTLPDGYLVHRSAFVATDSIFYMIDTDGMGCLLLDPETGDEIDRIKIAGLKEEWKWMAIENNVLYALSDIEKDPRETTVVRSQASHWHWGDLSKGYYEKRLPFGFGTTILAYDLAKRQVLWMHKEKAPLDSRAMVMGGGKIFFYGPGACVGCLDAKSGELLWTNDDPEIQRLISEISVGAQFEQTGIRTKCMSLYTPDALVFGEQMMLNVVALSTEDGKFLWTRRKTLSPVNMLYLDGNIISLIGPGGNAVVLDPLTGTTIEDLGFRKRACARMTSNHDYLFYRGFTDGLGLYDRKAKKVFNNAAIRPSCTDGALPANGLLYVGPWLCDCNLSLMGVGAMRSAEDFDFEPERAEKRLEIGEGDISNVVPLGISELDWLTYRNNNARNAASKAAVPGEVKKIWEFKAQSSFKPTAPTAAGGLIFLGGDDCKVRAIEAETGVLKWSYLTAGPIMQPPTIWNDRIYVGSGDGYIYALEAVTGRLLWRFRAAPVERRIMVYGSLCSTWPVNSGVLVENGVAYAAAGIIDYDGTYVYALDAITGKLKWQNTTSGHQDTELRKGVSAQGMLTIAGGRLWMPGGNVVSPAEYDLKTGNYIERIQKYDQPVSNRGEEIGILNDNFVIMGGRLRYSAVQNVPSDAYFIASQILPDEKAGPQVRFKNGNIPPAWDDKKMALVSGRFKMPTCYSSVTLAEHFGKKENKDELPAPLWVAGDLKECDVISLAITRNAVIAAYMFSGLFSERNHIYTHYHPSNMRWTVCALDPGNGSVIWQHDLSRVVLFAGRPHVEYTPLLPGGLCIDREGRIVVVMEDGSVVCLGG